MHTKSEMFSKLNELKEIRAGTGELFTPVVELVKSYFEEISQLTHDLQYTLHQIIQDAISRSTIYENQSAMPSIQTNYPTGYLDVRKVFIGDDIFNEILSVTREKFDSAYTEEVPPESNRYLDKWIAELKEARAKELKSLGTIADFCESNEWNRGLAQLFESVGEIVSTESLDVLAKQIFVDRGYKEMIESFNLKIYIPTSV